MVHRVRDQTLMRLVIINDLSRYFFKKVGSKVALDDALAKSDFLPLRSFLSKLN